MISLCSYTSNKVTRWTNWSFQAWMTFYPTRDQQTKCKSCGENGLNGDLLITYDVERRNPKGDVMVNFFFLQCKKIQNVLIFLFSGIKWLFRPLLCTLWWSTYFQKCGVYHWPEWFYARQKNRTGKKLHWILVDGQSLVEDFWLLIRDSSTEISLVLF